MGAAGTAIFSDDLAADVRAEFRSLVGEGLSPEEATRSLEEDYAESLGDQDDAPVFWISLAVAQHRLGRLLPRVLERALAAIDGGEDLRRWDDDPRLLAARRSVLDKARAEILGPQPEARRVSRPFRDENTWDVGQVVAYRLPSGRFCALVVVGHNEDLGGRSPVVRFLDWTGEAPPTESDLAGAGLLSPRSAHQSAQTMVAALSKREFPRDRVTVLPFSITVEERAEGYSAVFWRSLDGHLEDAFGLR